MLVKNGYWHIAFEIRLLQVSFGSHFCIMIFCPQVVTKFCETADVCLVYNATANACPIVTETNFLFDLFCHPHDFTRKPKIFS